MTNEKNTPQTAGTECEGVVSIASEYTMTEEEFSKFFQTLPSVAIEDAKFEKIKPYNA